MLARPSPADLGSLTLGANMNKFDQMVFVIDGDQIVETTIRDYEGAYIDIKQGYVDSGASPNQTKPIMTAANTAEEKKKKKKKKLLIF